jgi:hypothetical protein
MDRVKVELLNPQQAHQVLSATVWPAVKAHLQAGTQLVLELRGRTRSQKQSALMWSCAGDLSKQVKWFGKNLTAEGWVRFITGHLNGQELVPNMSGDGFISLEKGKSTSDMTIKEMTAVIDLMHAFGADQSVVWSPTSQGRLTNENSN